MADGLKKMKAREEFIRFAEGFLQTKFGKLSTVQQSYALANFYVREIHNRLRSEISEDDLELAVVDASNDLGCDLIHRDDGHVLVLQVKYRGEGAKEPPESITHFQTLLKRVGDPSIKGNERLLDRLNEIDWKNDSFSFVFVTFGKIDNQARKITEQTPVYPDNLKDLEQRSDWTYFDEQALNEELRSAHSFERGPSERAHTLFPVGEKGKRGSSAIIQVKADQFTSIIMALDAKQIVGAYEALGRDSLFSLNIRNFIGNTATNKNIGGLLKKYRIDFFYSTTASLASARI